MIIRLLLIASVLVMVVVVLRGSGSTRQLAVRRISAIAFALAWVVAVLSPDSLTRLANQIGVGRGTDLLLYALVVAVVVFAIGVQNRMMRLEARLAQLTRELAINGAARDGLVRVSDDRGDG